MEISCPLAGRVQQHPSQVSDRVCLSHCCRETPTHWALNPTVFSVVVPDPCSAGPAPAPCHLLCSVAYHLQPRRTHLHLSSARPSQRLGTWPPPTVTASTQGLLQQPPSSPQPIHAPNRATFVKPTSLLAHSSSASWAPGSVAPFLQGASQKCPHCWEHQTSRLELGASAA